MSRLCDPRVKPPFGAQLDPKHPINRGLVSCWLFNEGTGRLANNIGLVGGASVVQGGGRWQADQRGPALVLGEADGRMVPDPKSINPFLGENQDFALTFWWRAFPPHPAGTLHLLGNYAHQTGESCFLFYTYVSTYGSWVYYSVREYWPEGSRFFNVRWDNGTDGHWHHYTLTRRGTTIRLYQDGQLAFTDTDEHNALGLAPASQRLTLGRAPAGAQYCPGAFNELRLYDRSLSDSEIAQLYREPYAGVQSDSTRRFYHIPRPERKHHVVTVHRPDPRVKPPLGATLDPEHPLSRGLVGCWLFNEGTGRLANNIGLVGGASVVQGGVRWQADQRGPALVLGEANGHMVPDPKSIDPFLGENQDFALTFRWKAFPPHPAEIRHLLGNHPGVTSGVNYIFFFTYVGRVYCWVRIYWPEGEHPISAQWDNDTDGHWHHYALTRRGTTIRIYRDGQLAVTDTDEHNALGLAPGVRNLTLGMAPKGGQYCPGAFNELRLYNRALTKDEIAWLYAEPYAGIDHQSRHIFSAERYFPRRKQQLDGAPFGGEIR